MPYSLTWCFMTFEKGINSWWVKDCSQVLGTRRFHWGQQRQQSFVPWYVIHLHYPSLCWTTGRLSCRCATWSEKQRRQRVVHKASFECVFRVCVYVFVCVLLMYLSLYVVRFLTYLPFTLCFPLHLRYKHLAVFLARHAFAFPQAYPFSNSHLPLSLPSLSLSLPLSIFLLWTPVYPTILGI